MVAMANVSRRCVRISSIIIPGLRPSHSRKCCAYSCKKFNGTTFSLTRRYSSLSAPHSPSAKNIEDSIDVKKISNPLVPPVSPGDEDHEEQKRRDSSWKAMKYSFIAFGATFGILGSYMVYELGKPKRDENGNTVEDEFSQMPLIQQFFSRMLKEVNYYKRMIREPSREKLLPDPVPYPYIQPPYTLVLELTDVLVHPDWTYKTGWRFKKRPGVDQFLEQVAPPLFEVVVFTAEPGMTVFPILDALDPNGYIMYRLVRDATHFVDGHHVKDLDCLNRDLRKVIVIDWNGESLKFHPRNMLRLPRWKGNDDDQTLVALGTFLRTIAAEKVEDVREVLEYYQQYPNPVEAFREKQRKLLDQLEAKEKQLKDQPPTANWWTPVFLKPRSS
ncbi:mitochondrial import inner membrane translocase subunit TIM50-C-like [Zootermopsis nevadensis]|uniref:Mitochondrial import inner membrane translocase subunit TIM50 n=1 Tax=Zootermopsis nevadensis TaxID=136037 RepID=A0A067QML9_ZOONE|nr:mitochondrial import inner membrane translocase subunit TIM50-C-like [Zootermopsis nevadensis]KDR10492.1 Mitochondrial import inner membrane translocase subunit TIM50-C [Zootermopsis nevadensis]